MDKRAPLLGIGLYSVSEAARLLRAHSGTVRRWMQGYTFAMAGGRHPSSPLVHAELGQGRDVTFRDLMELQFIAMFRGSGVSLQYIRAAAAALATEFGTDHPLSSRRFDTDGKRIFVTVEQAATGLPPLRYTREVVEAQLCFEQAVKPFFRQLDIGTEGVARWWPLGTRGRVVLDPERSLGRPVDAATGVPTAVLYQMLCAGESEQSVAYWYDVPLAAVRQAKQYEEALGA